MANVASYWKTQRSSLQLGLRGGSHLALTDLHLEDLSEFLQCFILV